MLCNNNYGFHNFTMNNISYALLILKMGLPTVILTEDSVNQIKCATGVASIFCLPL